VSFHLRPYQPSDLEAIKQIKRRRYAHWFPGQEPPEFFEPDAIDALAAVVVVDEHDQPVAAVGARRVAELGSTVDDERISVHQLRRSVLPAWVKLGAHLYREGYMMAFAKVSSPTPAWEHGLERIARFRKSQYPHFYFDLEAVAKRLKPS
jgi:hypothetical protein